MHYKVPTDKEILFVLEIIDQVGRPALQAIETLVKSNRKWDNVSRNDFCRLAFFRQFLVKSNIVILLDISKHAARSSSAYLLSPRKTQRML